MPEPNSKTLMPVRSLGSAPATVSRIGLGVWPMAGLTSLGVTDADSIATVRRALDLGIQFLDTAYSYGIDGRSDRILAAALSGRRDAAIVASKVGARLDPEGKWTHDARPEAMQRQAAEILKRLGVERVDLMYLHAPDPDVPLEESADALQSIVDRGWARWAGVCNVGSEQVRRFHTRCPVVAVQSYFNMLQPQSAEELLGFCREHGVAFVAYWVLMKGILAGKLRRDHRFNPADRRRNYPIYQGERWQVAQDLLDELRILAEARGWTVAQLVLAWTLAQPGIDVALVGAKRPEQIEETAAAGLRELAEEDLAAMNRLVQAYRLRADWSR